MSRTALELCLAGLLAVTGSAAAQDGKPVAGFVVDASTRKEVPGALVRLLDQPAAVLTDSAGMFLMQGVPEGPHLISIARYGYETETMGITVPVPDNGWLDVSLGLAPFALEGITVVVSRIALLEQRIRDRENAAPTAVQRIDERRLVATASPDMADFFRVETSLVPVSCASDVTTGCILRRGQAIPPVICIDDQRALGGWDQISTYRPQDLYLVEVFGGGAQIRLYTHSFVDRMIRRPQPLLMGTLGC